MKKIYMFPAIFEPNGSGGYGVSFPDLPGCITVGDNFEHAVTMAKEVMALHLWNFEDDGEEIPESGRPETVNMSDFEIGSFVVPIDVYMPAYREKMANKAVKKTLTIPAWLNKVAEEQHMNFSQILQEALKERLHIGTH